MIAPARLSRNPHSSQAIPIYLNGRAVGQVAGGTFRKTVSASKHFLRRPQAICFDRCTLRDAEAAGALRVEVRDCETNLTYSAPMATFWEHCFPVLRGHGDQVGMGMDYRCINGEPSVAERRAGNTNKERLGLQIGLFA